MVYLMLWYKDPFIYASKDITVEVVVEERLRATDKKGRT